MGSSTSKLSGGRRILDASLKPPSFPLPSIFSVADEEALAAMVAASAKVII